MENYSNQNLPKILNSNKLKFWKDSHIYMKILQFVQCQYVLHSAKVWEKFVGNCGYCDTDRGLTVTDVTVHPK